MKKNDHKKTHKKTGFLRVIKFSMKNKNQTQNRKNSTIEVITNTMSGFFIAMALNLFLLPHFAEGIIQQSIGTAMIVGTIYTTVSYIRSYGLRRLFNRIGNYF